MCSANQLTGFYIMTTLTYNDLNKTGKVFSFDNFQFSDYFILGN